MAISVLRRLSSNSGSQGFSCLISPSLPLLYRSSLSFSPHHSGLAPLLAIQIEHCSKPWLRSQGVSRSVNNATKYSRGHDFIVPPGNLRVAMACTGNDNWNSIRMMKTINSIESPRGNRYAEHVWQQTHGKPVDEGTMGTGPISKKRKHDDHELAPQLPNGDLTVNVGLEIMGDGEYVLKIKKSFSSSTDEDEVERAKQMAQNAAMLLLHGEMLRDMGEKLLAQSQASFQSIFRKSAPPSKSDC